MTADTNAPNNSTFVQGTPVTLTFTLSGSTATAVNLAIVDERGNSIATASVPVVSGVATYTAPSTKLGYYRVNFSLPDGTTNAMLGTRPAGFISYAVVPDPSTRVNYGDALSHFGMEGGFSAAQGAIIPYLGIRYILSSAGGWASLEPNSAGQFAAAYAAAKAAGQQYPQQNPVVNAVTYNGAPWATFSIAQITTANMPGWAGPLSGTAGSQCTQFGALNSAGVAGLPGFASALATETAADYPSQSNHYYQVTWEPESPWCFGGAPAELVQYLQLVYSQIHAADPKGYVMGPTIFPGDDSSQTAALYTAGLGSVLDAFSIHPYYQYSSTGVSGLPENNNIVAATRAEIAAATAAVGHAIPMVGTESGFNSGNIGDGGTANILYEALGNVRENLILIGEGYSVNLTFYPADFWNSSPTETGNLYGYYFNLDPAIPYGTDKIGPKPVVPAYAAMTYFIDGSTTQGPVSGLTGTQLGYRFTRGGVNTVALWDYQAASSALTLTTPAENLQVCDWMGNCTNITSSGSLTLTLGAAPIYVIGQNL